MAGCERKRSQASHYTTMQVRAVGGRGKQGLGAASQTTVQFTGSSSRLLGSPSLPGYACLVLPVPSCWQEQPTGSMALAQMQVGLPQLVLTVVARSIFMAATAAHFNKIPATTLFSIEQWFSDFNTWGPPPYKAERSKYSTPKVSGVGRIFLFFKPLYILHCTA